MTTDNTTTFRPDLVQLLDVISAARFAIRRQQVLDRADAEWADDRGDPEWAERMRRDVAKADVMLATVEWLSDKSLDIAINRDLA